MWAAIASLVKTIVEAIIHVFIKEASKPDDAVVAGHDSAAAERLRRKLRAYKDANDSRSGSDSRNAG